jgi:hypothetical protein
MKSFQKMSTRRKHIKDQKWQIKKHISTRLALSGACLMLSASATISHATQIENDVTNETAITERLKAVRALSQTQQGGQAQENAEGREITQKTAWTNWEDWTKK